MDIHGHYEWEIRNFSKITGIQLSEVFMVGAYRWRLTCNPRAQFLCTESVSVCLECPEEKDTLPHRSPKARFKIIIRSHKYMTKDIVREGTSDACRNVCVESTIPSKDVSMEAGYLRADGALVVRAEIKVFHDPKRHKLSHNISGDFLALLDEPGGTSDLTLTAGGRPFAVHRAILAARCEFFKTMFTSGFADGTANEITLPDAGPDALAFLLRYIYGGVLDGCPREVLRPAVELADRLLLRDVCTELEWRLMDTSSTKTFMSDVLWASQTSRDELLARLEAMHVKHLGSIAEEDLDLVAEHNPKLLVRFVKKFATSTKLS